MTATFTWNFPSLDIAPSEDGLVDVIKTIHWRYMGSDGDYSTEVYGTVSMESPDPEDYVEYDDITKEDLELWVEDKLNILDMQSNLLSVLEALKNPPIVSRTPNF
jgi:hypothetical protein